MSKDLRTTISTRVAAARERAGVSQRKLARKSGLSQTTLSRIESGDRTPTIPELFILADALGCSYSELSPQSPVRDRLVRFARTVTGADTGPGKLTTELEHFFEIDAYLERQAIPR